MTNGQSSLEAQAQRLISLVTSDLALDVRTRRDATKLLALVPSNPALALSRLDTLAGEWAEVLPREKPTDDLCRCVSLEVYWEHHLADDVRIFYPTVTDYQSHITSQVQDPSTVLMN